MTIDHKTFFKKFREQLDSTLEQVQVDGLEFLLNKIETDALWKDLRHIAYALATVYHETAGSFQPVEEGYYLGSPAKVKRFQKTLRYYPYFGRGYVQTTWLKNYKRVDKEFGTETVNHPEIALDPNVAYHTLAVGMHQGWFTGKKLSDYIHGSTCDYKNARRIINGVDKAALIAGYARTFEQILKDSAAASSVSNLPDTAVIPNTGESIASAVPVAEAATDQPPIITETKVTEAKQSEESTVVTEQTATTPKGQTPEQDATKVTENGFISKMVAGAGGIGGIITLATGFITANASAIAVGMICLTIIILALMDRWKKTDVARMQAAADPEKYNVT